MILVRAAGTTKPDGLSHDATEVAICMAVFLFVDTVVVGLRLWVTRMRKRSLSIPDYMVFAALAFYYSYGVTTYLLLTIGGVGYPMKDLEPWRVTFAFKCFYYVQIAYAIGMGLIKCSILLILSDIFSISLIFQRISWGVIVLCVAWSLMTILIGFLNCRPIDFNWNLENPEGHCGNQNAAFAAVGIVDIATDTIIISLPVPMVLKLRLPLSKKIAVISVFAVGLLTIGITIVRTVTILTADFATLLSTGKMVFIWTLTEWGIAIIVCCAPMLRALFDRIVWHKPWLSTKHSSRNNESGSGSHSHSLDIWNTAIPLGSVDSGRKVAIQPESGSPPSSSRAIMHGFSDTAYGEDELPAEVNITTVVPPPSASPGTWPYKPQHDEEQGRRHIHVQKEWMVEHS